MASTFQFYLLSLLIYLIHADNLQDILSKFADEDCIQGEIIESNGKLRVQTLLQSSISQDEPHIVLNIAQREAEKLIEKTTINEHPVSYVNNLANHNKIEVSYDVVNKEGPQHKPTFYMRLTLGEEEYEGVGKNKKEAKKMAAVAAIENTLYLPPKRKSKENEEITPTVSLNNLSQKFGFKVEYFTQGKSDFRLEKNAHYSIEVDGNYLEYLNKSIFYDDDGIPIEDDSNSQGPFKVIVSIGNQKFTGFGHSKKAARHDAAEKALRSLKEQHDNDCDKDLIKSPTSLLHEIASKLGIDIEFDVISDSGPDHKKQFTIQCTFDKYVTEGEGMSKKEAKTNAAYSMLHQIQTIGDIKVSKTIDRILEKQKIKRKNVMDDVNKFIVNAKESFVSMVQNLYNTIEGSFNNYDEAHKDENDKKRQDTNSKDKSVKGKHDTKSKDNIDGSFKDKLLRSGLVTKYNFYQLKNKHYAFVTLNTRPSYICLSEGASRNIAENGASFNGLKFIKKYKILPAESETINKEDDLDRVKVEYQMIDLKLETNE